MTRSLAAIALCLAMASPAGAAVDPASLIVPGRGIGPVHLGDRFDDLVKVLGEPVAKTYVDADHTLAQWPRKALLVAFEGDEVVLVGTNSRRYQTSTGLKVGLAGTDARTIFPHLTMPAARGVFGLGDETLGINFLYHPVDVAGRAVTEGALPADWTIDEINVFRPVAPRVP